MSTSFDRVSMLQSSRRTQVPKWGYSLDSDLCVDIYRLRNLIVQMEHKDGAAREEAASLAAVSTAAAAAAASSRFCCARFVAKILNPRS